MSQHTPTPRNMKTFFIIWIGQLVSIIGSGLTSFAPGVWIFEQTGKATPFAMMVLCSSLPRILLAPIAGALADRWNRRWRQWPAHLDPARSVGAGLPAPHAAWHSQIQDQGIEGAAVLAGIPTEGHGRLAVFGNGHVTPHFF